MKKKMSMEELQRHYDTSWDKLNETGHLSPIVGMGLVTLKQLEDYCGVEHDAFQRARQKAKADMDALGANTDVARHMGATVAGAQKTEHYGYILPLEDGGSTEIPCGRYSYFTAVAVARLVDELHSVAGAEKIEEGIFEPATSGFVMDEKGCARMNAAAHSSSLEVKTIPFLDSELMAARDVDGQIWAGVSCICNGIGLSKNDKDRQVKNVQVDEVLKDGCLKFDAGVFDPNNVTVALKLDYIPLWLAKISITPAMKKERPELAVALKQYQLRAKDVLAEAFLPGWIKGGAPKVPQDFPSALRAYADAYEKNIDLTAAAEANRPKVQFAEAVSGSKKSITVGDFAKLVYGMTGMGRNTLFRWMRDRGILQKNGNVPYQRYLKDGYFKLVEQFKYGHLVKTPMITGAGQTYLFQRLQSEFGAYRAGVQ